MHFADHLFVIILAVVYPFAGYVSFNRLVRRVLAGEVVDRTKLYVATVTGHWILFLIAIVLWRSQGRDWSTLGFGFTIDTGLMVGAGLTVAAILLLVMQLRRVSAAGMPEIRDARAHLGNLEIVIPRNGNELGRFYGVALTAGIVEETLWRGFMIWYFSQFLLLWSAALISAIGFGLAHAYQGVNNLPKITLVGAAFVGLYLVTGSLWLPMVLHAAVDVLQGRLAFDVIRRSDNESPAANRNNAPIASSAS
ncbi:MAG: CPBP family intramembrane metalloprotease [Proteobacteria bacterium]|nr:CPBP family intramembrane metalloprotease [Pseudomonadota bacterium]